MASGELHAEKAEGASNAGKTLYSNLFKAPAPVGAIARVAQLLRQKGNSGYRRANRSGISVIPSSCILTRYDGEARPGQKKKTAPEQNPEAGV